ncbi:MAG TPA: ABC transporter permease subunit, partial [Chthoniobacteraceae bacterium]
MALCVLVWYAVAGKPTTTKSVDDWGDTVTVTKRVGLSADLPTPAETWVASRQYVMKPLEKRGELDQGILRFTWLSLVLVVQGYAIALIIGIPLGFCLGLSKTFAKMFDPIFQILRPVSPLAWLPLGMVLFLSAKVQLPGGTLYTASELAAIFTVAICSMWPTVLNTAVGVRAIPTDYINVARVL